jgi:hypothetical protein
MEPQTEIHNFNLKMDGEHAITKLFGKNIIECNAMIEQLEINTLFNVTFFDKKFHIVSTKIMDDLKIKFCGAGVNDLGNYFIQLSTHEREAELISHNEKMN